jgi:hypothetical protein
LTEGWAQCLRQSRPEAAQAARQRIVENFSVQALVARTEAALMTIV